MAADEDDRLLALCDLDRDMHASTATSPRESVSKRWTSFHFEWFVPGVPMVPLTEESVRALRPFSSGHSAMHEVGYEERWSSKMVHDLEIDVISQGPVCVKSLLISAAFFMLREAEIANAELNYITFTGEAADVTLHLTVSNTNVKAPR